MYTRPGAPGLPAALLLFALLAASCGPPDRAHDEGDHGVSVGSVDFQVSCSESVRPAFDRAVAFLHHMQYVEAQSAFEAIVADEPDCAMAHWGLAMTLFQPLWPERPGPEVLRRGWEEVRRARELGAPTPREEDLIAAAEAFFREPETADWWTRIGRWSEAMQMAHDARPQDTETGAFFALSQLAAAPAAPDRMAYHARAATVLLGIFERTPDHPGAIHYTIHANDVDTRAGESLEVVRSYDDIAPNVPHALHMPTHIFVRLGDWPQVIEWNRKSADAALGLPAGDRVSHHYVHALDYLVYAYLQRGEDARAQAVLDELAAVAGPFQGTFISAFHLAAMPARDVVERRAWAEARALEPRTPAGVEWDRFWWAESLSWFARGVGAAQSGDATEADRAEARLVELRDAARAAGENAFGTYIEIDRRVLAAVKAAAAGKVEAAVATAREAGDLEATIQKHPVTPGSAYPPYEALGDILAAAGRHGEAVEAYERSLQVWPGRYNSLLGAARSAAAMGDAARARGHYRSLLELTRDAETTRSGVAEARASVEG